MLELGCVAAVLTGGHRKDRPADLYMDKDGDIQWLEGEFSGPDLHGTGCVFSAAIAAYLAHSIPIYAAVQKAKLFTARAISSHITLDGDVKTLNLIR
ncbi:hypothetical protein AMJ86_09530 [bacterium SM23_57]|nr:MAG: hypothetical protein AMJ86_09530 [bacterium SM23_57]